MRTQTCVSVLMGLAVIILAGCSGGGVVVVDEHHHVGHSASLAVVHAAGDPLILTSGERLDLSIQLTNESDLADDRYIATGGREVRFEVVDRFGRVVYDSWDWVPRQPFTVSYDLDAGDSHSWHHVWYSHDEFGYDLLPGDYLVYGTLTGSLGLVDTEPQAPPIVITIIRPLSG